MWQPFFSSDFFVSFLFFPFLEFSSFSFLIFSLFLFFVLCFTNYSVFFLLIFSVFDFSCFVNSFSLFLIFPFFDFSLFCIFSLYQFFVFCLFICWFGSSYQLPSNPNLGWKLLQLNIKIKLCCDPSEAKSCYIYILVTDNPKNKRCPHP